jgi:hypothetical protein
MPSRVIPGRAEGANPESSDIVLCFSGFRIAASRRPE